MFFFCFLVFACYLSSSRKTTNVYICFLIFFSRTQHQDKIKILLYNHQRLVHHYQLALDQTQQGVRNRIIPFRTISIINRLADQTPFSESLWNLYCTQSLWKFYIKYSNVLEKFWKLLPSQKIIHSK